MPRNREWVTILIDIADAPEDRLERIEMEKHATRLADDHLRHFGGLHKSTIRGELRHLFLYVLHPLGVHEWVRVLGYDRSMDRIIDPGKGRVLCRNCN